MLSTIDIIKYRHKSYSVSCICFQKLSLKEVTRNKVIYSNIIPGQPSTTSEVCRMWHLKCWLKSFSYQKETPRYWQWPKVFKEITGHCDSSTWISKCWPLSKMTSTTPVTRTWPRLWTSSPQSRQNKVILTHVPPEKRLSPKGLVKTAALILLLPLLWRPGNG